MSNKLTPNCQTVNYSNLRPLLCALLSSSALLLADTDQYRGPHKNQHKTTAKKHRHTGPVQVTPPTYKSTGDVISFTSLEQLQAATQAADIHHAVKVFAPWCGHCRNLKQAFEQSAQDHRNVQHAEIDGDAYPALAKALGVKGYPTTLIYPPHSTSPSQTLVGATNVVRTISELNAPTN